MPHIKKAHPSSEIPLPPTPSGDRGRPDLRRHPGPPGLPAVGGQPDHYHHCYLRVPGYKVPGQENGIELEGGHSHLLEVP